VKVWTDALLFEINDGNNVLDNSIYLNEKDYEFITRNKRGFGYWLWKPIIVSRMLSEMAEGDLFVYADAGCELSTIGFSRFCDYLSAANQKGGLFFSLPFVEKNWTKKQVVTALMLTDDELETNQLQATFFILKNCNESRELVRKWLELCRRDNYAMVDDSGLTLGQRSSFREHRHDQSLLSILVKRGDFDVIEWEDFYEQPLYFVNSWVLRFPVHARRTKYFRIVFLLSLLSSERKCLECNGSGIIFIFNYKASQFGLSILKRAKNFVRLLLRLCN
jgi:hypothetical protein